MSALAFELPHPAGIAVVQGLTQERLLRDVPSVIATRRDMGTGWWWYTLPPFEDGGAHVSVALGFEGDLLKHIILSDSNPKFGTSWNDWSEDKERARAESIRSWLDRRGFGPGQYGWGGVWAGFDPKGGSGCAAVRFT